MAVRSSDTKEWRAAPLAAGVDRADAQFVMLCRLGSGIERVKLLDCQTDQHDDLISNRSLKSTEGDNDDRVSSCIRDVLLNVSDVLLPHCRPSPDL